MLEIDHIFIFTKFGGHEAQRLIDSGLTEGKGNVHPGQGTANRRFFFDNSYLELLWIVNEEEVQNPLLEKTHLWKRSKYNETGFSPFGLCLRTNQEEIFESGFRYKPPYLRDDLHIDMYSSLEFPFEPLLFKLPESMAPKRYKKAQHALGITAITKLTFTIPFTGKHSIPISHVIKSSLVEMTQGENFSLAIEFDNNQKGLAFSFEPELPLEITC